MSSVSCSPVHELIALAPRTCVWVAVHICGSTLRTEPARICPPPFLPSFHLSVGCQFRAHQGSWQARESVFRALAPSPATLFRKPPSALEDDSYDTAATDGALAMGPVPIQRFLCISDLILIAL